MTVDMANGPVQRISPFLDTVALLEAWGQKQPQMRSVLGRGRALTVCGGYSRVVS